MAAFTITSVDFANPASIAQTFSFDYKVWNAPDNSWINIGSSVAVNTDGTLIMPITVTGLEPSTLYYIRAANTCNSPLEYYIQEIQTGDIFFLLGSTTDYGVNYSASMDIIEGVANISNSSITIESENLPSFCTLSEQAWEGQPLYPYVKFFTINVAPTGIVDSGIYNFSISATDGNLTITKNYSLTVDNLGYARFNRPYSQPTSRTVTIENPELWTYTANLNLNGVSYTSSYADWGFILGGAQLRFTPNPVEGEQGKGFILSAVKRTLVSNLWSDSILIYTTVNS